ncbi:hypothetical protein QJU43_04290 [Pasteurella atlantica]|uniref:Uncharacterized protein n=2 Tax=Pasteurellaceae TaxID=712 RepID=A0ACC6HKT0_9PAST|nr:hypothetical protein [Pasteurella atlantica]MDP8033656.1 hypothetical protein [Pasteurella atlantica]MDP8035564.1 hypothetical protein [Pasteurella atlantica]MDP8037515.1 hypothetical protein [Pasteurella atlantica]MDP8047864.1 hypothetical protein [Pasteurella atlantica]MDP8049819.1 hypothetical protein [Pasteurella atlantica]
MIDLFSSIKNKLFNNDIPQKFDNFKPLKVIIIYSHRILVVDVYVKNASPLIRKVYRSQKRALGDEFPHFRMCYDTESKTVCYSDNKGCNLEVFKNLCESWAVCTSKLKLKQPEIEQQFRDFANLDFDHKKENEQ